GPGGAAAQAAQHVLGKRKLQELVSQVDPLYRLEPAVEDLFLEVADEFIESVSHMACRLAKHRRGDTLEVRDVQMHLERHWNLRVPGFAADEIRSLRRPGNVSVHTQRLKAIAESKASRKPS
ncbi:transcription initiation factor TFIID subunit A-domain-containing protein, partial [Piptocephalis cylindrospora]